MSDYHEVSSPASFTMNGINNRSRDSSKRRTSSEVSEKGNPRNPQPEPLLDECEEHVGLVNTSPLELFHELPIPREKLSINWFDAGMHLIKGNLGPGCLNLPRAFALSGGFLGTFLLCVVVTQGVYSMVLLAELKQILLDSNYRANTFMDVAHASLGSRGRTFVQVFLFVLQTGVCCVFLDLIATNLRAQTRLSASLSIFLVTGALLFIVLFRHMKDLRLLSTIANCFMISAVLTASVTAVVQIAEDNIALPPKATSDLGDAATFISSMFFAFEGIGLVLPIGKCS
jgi:amino acid permease